MFRSGADALETFVAPLSDDMNRFLTRYETPKDPPNYYTRNRDTTSKRPVTAFKDPEPQIRGITSSIVTYKRKDGVTLSGTLYLPAGLPEGHEAAADHVGVSARVRRRRHGEPGDRIAEPFHDDQRLLAPVPAAVGLRRLRQSDDADHRAGRDGQRSLRRAARRERGSGDRSGRVDGRRRSRSHRRRRATATAPS